MVLSKYFRVIGCRLIMSCYLDHYVRDLFLRDTITSQKGSHIHLNPIISERQLGNITHAISYTNHKMMEYEDPFLQHRQMEEGQNSNTMENFDSSWVSVLDEFIWDLINRYIFTGCMFVLYKPHPFRKEYHTNVCDL